MGRINLPFGTREGRPIVSRSQQEDRAEQAMFEHAIDHRPFDIRFHGDKKWYMGGFSHEGVPLWRYGGELRAES